jgi:hypothetical protein
VLCWLIVRRRWSVPGLAALGALAALMAMVREQDALLAIGPAADFARTLVRRARARPAGVASGPEGEGLPGAPTLGGMLAGAAAAAVAFSIVFLPQAASYIVLNGRLGPSQLVTRKMDWTAPHALQVLGSPAHGLLFWTPLAALALAGLVLLVVRGHATPRPDVAGAPPVDVRWIAACGLLMAAGQVYVAGSVESWTVAGAFGQRRFVALTPLLVIGLAGLFRLAPAPAARRALAAACAIGIWWNVALMAQFGAGLMDRQRLEPARNAYVAFLVLPRRLPELAWRYFTDRPSFYGSEPARP